MINTSWRVVVVGGVCDGEWRWGLGGTSATHQKQQHFPGFVATSSVGSLYSLKISSEIPLQHTTSGLLDEEKTGGAAEDVFKTHAAQLQPESITTLGSFNS